MSSRLWSASWPVDLHPLQLASVSFASHSALCWLAPTWWGLFSESCPIAIVGALQLLQHLITLISFSAPLRMRGRQLTGSNGWCKKGVILRSRCNYFFGVLIPLCWNTVLLFSASVEWKPHLENCFCWWPSFSMWTNLTLPTPPFLHYWMYPLALKWVQFHVPACLLHVNQLKLCNCCLPISGCCEG